MCRHVHDQPRIIEGLDVLRDAMSTCIEELGRICFLEKSFASYGGGKYFVLRREQSCMIGRKSFKRTKAIDSTVIKEGMMSILKRKTGAFS